MSKLSDEIRKMFGESDQKRDVGLKTPAGIMRYDDIIYGSNKKWQILDVYRPKNKEGESLPILVSVHGGGWVYGDKERYQYYCMSLAEQGFAVVNYTYRLGPEYKYPAALEDTNMVFHWIFQNVEKYGFDSNNIFAVGDSVGANLLYIYTTMCTNADYASMYNFQIPDGFVPTAIGLNCGAYRIEMDKNPEDLTTLIMKEYLPDGGTTRELNLINAMKYMNKNFPPVYLMTANEDFLREQAPLLEKKLKELKIPYRYKIYGTAEHPLGHVFHCDIKTEDAQKCNIDECEFFREIMMRKGKTK